jgi:excinuclease ABC subunit C
MLTNKLKSLPDAPGIYLFYNSKKELIYIGKATSLRNRVRSYFSRTQKSFRPIEEMIHEVADIRMRETDSVLEAIILEALEIKKNLPRYNVLGKDDKSWNYLVLTRELFPKLKPIRQHEMIRLDAETKKRKFLKVFGPFPHLKTAETLKILRRLFFYSTCEPNQARPCFYYQIRECLGVCTGEIMATEYRKKVVKPLSLFLQGKKQIIIRNFKKEMAAAAKAENFESAGRLRNQIAALEKIQDMALINKNFFEDEIAPKTPFRVEGCDISNLGASGKVGSLVVFDEHGAVKSDYKRFKIKTVAGASDVACLREVFARRLKHADWPLPDYFLVDGGKPQLNTVKKVLVKNNLQIPLIGIAKGRERKKNEFFVNPRNEQTLAFIQANQNLLIQTRDEAHRFAIAYQRTTRRLNK